MAHTHTHYTTYTRFVLTLYTNSNLLFGEINREKNFHIYIIYNKCAAVRRCSGVNVSNIYYPVRVPQHQPWQRLCSVAGVCVCGGGGRGSLPPRENRSKCRRPRKPTPFARRFLFIILSRPPPARPSVLQLSPRTLFDTSRSTRVSNEFFGDENFSCIHAISFFFFSLVADPDGERDLYLFIFFLTKRAHAVNTNFRKVNDTRLFKTRAVPAVVRLQKSVRIRENEKLEKKKKTL